MLKKLFFGKITDRAADLVYLFALWWFIYAFTVWNYGSWHWIRPRGHWGEQLSFAADFVVWGVLVFEFAVNFPCKGPVRRFFLGVAALLGLLTAMPTF